MGVGEAVSVGIGVKVGVGFKVGSGVFAAIGDEEGDGFIMVIPTAESNNIKPKITAKLAIQAILKTKRIFINIAFILSILSITPNII